MRERQNNLAQLRRLVLETTQSESELENRRSLVGLLLLFAIKLIEANQDNRTFSAAIEQKVANLYRELAKITTKDILSALPDLASISNQKLETLWQKLSQPKMQSLFSDESYLGYIYQFFSTGLRKGIHLDLEQGNKTLSHKQLVAFTQLYTPDWVVDFLLQNTVLPQWKSGLSESVNRNFCLEDLSLSRPKHHGKTAGELKLIDPACGAGHFLVRALDLFGNLYASEGMSSDQALQAAIENNLFGTDIDPMALWVCSLVLLTRCLRLGVEEIPRLNLVSVKDNGKDDTDNLHNLLGSLSQDFPAGHILKQSYDVVVTNPPYIGRKLLDRSLKVQLKRLYPTAHHDLCAAFVARGIELLKADGRLGLIGQASLLYLPSYQDLRKELIEKCNLISVVEAGPGVFPLHGGEKVNSALMVIANQAATTSHRSCFIDLTSFEKKADGLNELIKTGNYQTSEHVFLRQQNAFLAYDRCSYNYRCPDVVLKLMKILPPLSNVADVRQGLATTDNKRFVRYWQDVDAREIGKRWFPYIKGGGSQRWLGTIEYLVDWQDNGAAIKQAVQTAYPYLKGKIKWVVKNEEFYFRAGLTFSFVNTGDFAVRKMPAGCIFDVGGSAIFAYDLQEQDYLLACLNSTFSRAVARVLNPTVNMQVGDLRRLPVVTASQTEKRQLAELAGSCCLITEWLLRFEEARLGRSIPQEVIACREGADLGSVWQKYFDERKVNLLKLEELEKSIDDLIVKIISRQAELTFQEKEQLVNWLAHHQHKQKSNMLGPNDFETFEQLIEAFSCSTLSSRSIK
jgi:hypothetical protein